MFLFPVSFALKRLIPHDPIDLNKGQPCLISDVELYVWNPELCYEAETRLNKPISKLKIRLSVVISSVIAHSGFLWLKK